ncbi:ribonuclease M5 [Companilactobacillus sp. RD055328]|uniref:ribonuclease M5 n=1 Tax=Companilactobacillus sp. RD055328 TaxID=2916634 RepID=UPI001FC7FA91|nr:ribonuclease M5 [Companilactobacillus sp. RD055328]GKQ42322.1 ribonuclease M5 [Companilactobacillus sp. RD055328]
MDEINEVIVVEGKSDTTHLRSFFKNIDTIETKGSAIDQPVIDQIKVAVAKRGAIVLTDPDFNGNKIRQKIVDQVPEIKQAFLPRAQAVPRKSGNSLGVEHATKNDIEEALMNVVTPKELKEEVTQAELMNLKLIGYPESKKLRELVGDRLHIGYGNSKQFLKKVNQFSITIEELTQAIQQEK